MKKISLSLFAVLIFTIPFLFSLATNQIFELNKFVFLLVMSGIIHFSTAIAFFANKIKKPRFDNKQKIALLTFFIFLILLIYAGTINSISPTESFWGTTERHQGLLLFLTVFSLCLNLIFLNPNRYEIFLFILLPLIITGLIQSGIVIWQHFNPKEYFTDLELDHYYDRSIGTFGQPNLVGRFLVFPFVILFSLLFHRFDKNNSFIKTFIAIAFLIIAFGLFYTVSRSAWLGAFSGMIIFLIIRMIIKERWAILLAVVFSTVVVLFSGVFLLISDSIASKNARYIIFSHSPEFVEDFYKNNFERRKEAINHRYLVWQKTPELTKEKPILGWGLESQEIAYQMKGDEELYSINKDTRQDRAHNEIMDFLIQVGIAGTIAYLLFIFSSLFTGARHLSKNPVAIGIFAVILASGISRQFEFFSITDNLLFFLFITILAFLRFEKNEEKISNSRLIWILFFTLYGSFTIYAGSNIWLADKYYYEASCVMRVDCEVELENDNRVLTGHNKLLRAYLKAPFKKNYAEDLTESYLRQRNVERAEEIVEAMEEKFPYWSHTYTGKAKVKFVQGDLQEAEKSLEKAISLYPANTDFEAALNDLKSVTNP